MTEFGIFNVMQQRHRAKPSAQVFREAVDQVRVAEELGFAEIWFVEHHASNYSLCPSPLTMAAHCAGFTSRIRLGTAVIVAPLYLPARLLAEIAMVDTLSDGRLDIGIGTGYQAYEFAKFGVDIANKNEMTYEMLDLIEGGLAHGSVQHEGTHYDIDELAISVDTIQQPHPPIWLATSDPVLQRRAAAQGHRLFVSGHLGGVSYLEQQRDAIVQSFADEGIDNEPPLGMLRLAFATHDEAEARHYADCARYQQRVAAALKQRRQRVSDDHMVEEVPFEGEPDLDKMLERMPIGHPEVVAERICNEIRAIRPQQIILQPQVGDMSAEASRRSMELWVTDVMPLVEKELSTP